MAETKKRNRPAFPLTLAAQRRYADGSILRSLGQSRAGNPTGSLPVALPGRLPEGLPAQAGNTLGHPRDLKQAAKLIGCSPWTVRQKLIPRGLPFFRSGASGKLIFYEAQIVRWIEIQQGRGGLKNQ